MNWRRRATLRSLRAIRLWTVAHTQAMLCLLPSTSPTARSFFITRRRGVESNPTPMSSRRPLEVSARKRTRSTLMSPRWRTRNLTAVRMTRKS
ncbi:hypothetical protein EV126DRAFT_414008 [Verticillium dahliae]|nr:hypothetical protein EV126DRAFT_414008 [Verticillium dahliae]